MLEIPLVWQQPPSKLFLTDNEVHVWRAFLNQPEERWRQLRDLLTFDERARAARFYFERDRRCFVIARGILRTILARYLNSHRDCLPIAYTAYGKPYLADECGHQWLRFNLSHSGELALFAFSRGRELGVDIERVRSNMEYRQIALKFFSEREASTLFSLPAESQQQAFFLCWTRKEAYIKGIGEGLTLPLSSFDVSFVPGEMAALLSAHGSSHEAGRWSLYALEPGAGYEAALVTEGGPGHLKCWQWVDGQEQ